MKRFKAVILGLVIALSLMLTACASGVPYIGENGNWFIGDTDLGVSAQGPAGEPGAQGPKGEKGDTGAQGPEGEDGEAGAAGEKGEDGPQGVPGEKGETGSRGPQGQNGVTPHIGENGNWWIGSTDTGVYAGGYVEDCTDGLEFAFRTVKGKAGAVVCGYVGSEKEIVIPNFFANIPVVGIDADVFRGNAEITSVRLPSGLLSLPEGAFEGCTSLSEIDFGGAEIPEIKGGTFAKTALDIILLPSGTKKIDASAFSANKETIIYIPASVTEILGDFSQNIYLVFEADALPSDLAQKWNDAQCARHCLGVKSTDIVRDEESGAYLLQENGGYSLLSYMPVGTGILALPAAYLGTPILRVRSHAVVLSAGVTDLVIPPYVERLDGAAISASVQLRSVYLPSALVQAAEGALAFSCPLYLFEAEALSSEISAAFGADFSSAERIFSLPVGTLRSDGQYLYLLHTDGVTLLRFFGNADTLAIPSTLEDKSVVAIQSGFFKGYYTTLITVPKTVLHVGRHAFVFCPYIGEGGVAEYFPCRIEFAIEYPTAEYDPDMILKDAEDVMQKQVYFDGRFSADAFSR